MPQALPKLSVPAGRIREEITAQGAISFARFMELALYCPVSGYYERKDDTIGRHGDFYTSVSVGSLFGELLAFQFSEWLEAEIKDQKSEPKIVEAGAHDGKLAQDILGWLKLRRPALLERIEYCIREPSAKRRGWQKETLAEFSSHVRWFESDIKRQPAPVTGIIFSNELLDAMPVHRVGWDAQRRDWFEWGVTSNGDEFAWTRLPLAPNVSQFRQHIPTSPELLDVLPDGFTTEICPVAESWWREAAESLDRGKLVTIDYGLTSEEFFTPQRANGTLRAYHRHRLSADLLAHPGEQDLTAHVNFTAIQSAGEAAGLRTETFETQAKFLTCIAERAWQPGAGFGRWTPRKTREFQTLTHPQHLGRPFRVLVQGKRTAREAERQGLSS